jgi:hypothetical protein
LSRRLDEPLDLIGGVDVWLAPYPSRDSKCMGRWDLVTRILGPHVPRETPNDVQSLTSLGSRRGLCCPIQSSLAANGGFTSVASKLCESAKLIPRWTALKPEGEAKSQVAVDVFVQHYDASGQGCVTL